jgi:hypothetical protein
MLRAKMRSTNARLPFSTIIAVENKAVKLQTTQQPLNRQFACPQMQFVETSSQVAWSSLDPLVVLYNASRENSLHDFAVEDSKIN